MSIGDDSQKFFNLALSTGDEVERSLGFGDCIKQGWRTIYLLPQLEQEP